MLKKKVAFFMALVFTVGLFYQTGSRASEIDMAAEYQEEEKITDSSQEERETSEKEEENKESDAEAIEKKEDSPIMDIDMDETESKQEEEQDRENKNTAEEEENDTPENSRENRAEDNIRSDQENKINEDILGQGFRYYLNLYLYTSQKEYLEFYEAYLSKKKAAYEELYESGEVTNDTVLDCATQLASCIAEKNVLDNETEYCKLFLKEYNLNFDDFQVEKEKTIQNREFYESKYEGEEWLQVARYWTNFQNAKALLTAKEIEITSVKEKVKMKNLLYEAGEITELERMEEEVLLKKAEYEKAQYYVNLNEAYYNLEQNDN